jgi:aminoglycoside phosphotransferase (APT) family kinase protein
VNIPVGKPLSRIEPMATTELLDEAAMAERLTSWLAASKPVGSPTDLPADARDEVTVRRLAEGHSNLTYVVAVGGRELILRRPPSGPLLPTAHDVVREYRVLDLLARSEVPVRAPLVVAVCEDDSVLGAPFYLMQRAVGIVIRDELPAWLDASGQRILGLDLAAALAEIHCVPVAPFVASGLGREGGYLERQLRRWVGQREGIEAAVAAAGGRARSLPDYDSVRDWLRDHLPTEQRPAVVHGDYKLDNVVVSGGEDHHGVQQENVARVAAVVDWEMATVGDPRADLGYLLSFWPESGERYPLGNLVTGGPGFPDRAELVDVWEQGTGRPAGNTTWFVTLAVWKLAVLLEASYHRHLAGTTDDPFFATLEQGVPDLLAHAREVCGV